MSHNDIILNDNKVVPAREKNVVTQIRTRNSAGRTCKRKKVMRCPSLNSFLINPDTLDQSIIKMHIKFVKNHIVPISELFYPIKPLTNSWRMNYQSKQAIRVFYGKTIMDKTLSPCSVRRAVYGPLSVLKSYGTHPSHQYKVLPFTNEIETMSSSLLTFLKKKGW